MFGNCWELLLAIWKLLLSLFGGCYCTCLKLLLQAPASLRRLLQNKKLSLPFLSCCCCDPLITALLECVKLLGGLIWKVICWTCLNTSAGLFLCTASVFFCNERLLLLLYMLMLLLLVWRTTRGGWCYVLTRREKSTTSASIKSSYVKDVATTCASLCNDSFFSPFQPKIWYQLLLKTMHANKEFIDWLIWYHFFFLFKLMRFKYLNLIGISHRYLLIDLYFKFRIH
jgi:hypothetical protein